MKAFVVHNVQGWTCAGALATEGQANAAVIWRRTVSRSSVPSHPGQATSDPSCSRGLRHPAFDRNSFTLPMGRYCFLLSQSFDSRRKLFVIRKWSYDTKNRFWRRRESNPGPIILKCSFYTFSLQINFGKTYPTNGGLIPILLRVQFGSKRATNPKGP